MISSDPHTQETKFQI
jgi:hypothetical protein